MPAPTTPPSFFATTRWTLVHEAAAGGDPHAVVALGDLFATYWPPLYRYARRKGKSKEDAEDLVQGFLAHLVEVEALQKTDRTKGRFRTFLLGSFTHWMINEWKHAARDKRGGGIAPLSFDWNHAETGLSLEPADERSPDKLFDREWTLALLDTVLTKLARLCQAEGAAATFETLKPCLTAEIARTLSSVRRLGRVKFM